MEKGWIAVAGIALLLGVIISVLLGKVDKVKESPSPYSSLEDNLEYYVAVLDEKGNVVDELPSFFNQPYSTILDARQALAQSASTFSDENTLEIRTREKYKTGEIIVKLKSNLIGFPEEKRIVKDNELHIAESSLSVFVKKIKLQEVKKLYSFNDNMPKELDNTFVFYFEEGLVSEAVRELNDFSFVDYAEPNYVYTTSSISPIGKKIPNDPMFVDQWGLDNEPGSEGDYDIDAPEAWYLEEGDNDVVIAIIDTGIDYNHEDLKDNILRDKFGKVIGYDFYNDDSDPIDDHGHGTHVAGIAAAVTNNGKGIAGTCWRCKLLPVKFMGEGGSGRISDAAEAIYFAVENNADILSNSWGGGGYSATLEDAVNYAYNRGVFIVAAAGNDNTRFKFYPAAFDHVFSVSAINLRGEKAEFSNYGSQVDIAAPGEAIISTVPTSNCDLCAPSGYNILSGTSMAAPFVSGIVGLVISSNPGLTNDEIFSLLHTEIQPINKIGRDFYVGTRIVNAFTSITRGPIPVSKLDTSLDEVLINSRDIRLSWKIRGSAKGENFKDYRVEVGSGFYPIFWELICEGNVEVREGVLCDFDPSLYAEGYLSIRLITEDDFGGFSQDIQGIYLHHSLMDGWPQYIGAYSDAYPNFDDIDGDKTFEISIGSGELSHRVMMFNHDGTFLKNWPFYDEKFYSQTTGAFGDLDGDGKKELVSASGGGCHFSDPLSRGLWSWKVNSSLYFNPYFIGGCSLGVPTIVDLENDGKLEIITVGFDNKVYAFDSYGNTKGGWPIHIGSTVPNGLAVGDLDKDGNLEIVVFGHDDTLYVFRYDGTLLEGWPKNFGKPLIPQSPIIGDVNNDGDLDIIVTYYRWDETEKSEIVVLNMDGSILEGWPVEVNGQAATPSLGDLDEDGFLEIVFVLENKIWMLNYKGTTVLNWPVSLPYRLFSTPALADINQDYLVDVIVGSAGGAVYALNFEGEFIEGWPKFVPEMVFSSPGISDLDNDSNIEVVLGSYDPEIGRLYVWELNSAYNPSSVEWSRERYDSHNTGNYNFDKICSDATLYNHCSTNLPLYCPLPKYKQSHDIGEPNSCYSTKGSAPLCGTIYDSYDLCISQRSCTQISEYCIDKFGEEKKWGSWSEVDCVIQKSDLKNNCQQCGCPGEQICTNSGVCVIKKTTKSSQRN